ncbi:WSSV059 [White spot syndrome virus]|uniref:WSSV059 n=1 Tax=White spot syndrome virus TaxID=92652 RepID=Q8QTG2_WSSV|nr:WSSV059 [Shrimp white spot syndrome virus]
MSSSNVAPNTSVLILFFFKTVGLKYNTNLLAENSLPVAFRPGDSETESTVISLFVLLYTLAYNSNSLDSALFTFSVWSPSPSKDVRIMSPFLFTSSESDVPWPATYTFP